MYQTESEFRKAAGYSQVELIVGFALVALLFLGLLYTVNPYASDDGDGVPVYRSANAIYIHNSLESQRVAVLGYYDMTSALPGDDKTSFFIGDDLVVGDKDGRIERDNNEYLKVFADMHRSGLIADDEVRVRSKRLNLLWTSLVDGEGNALASGHFFRLKGINHLEAKAYDQLYDDGQWWSGRVFVIKQDDLVDLYVGFDLFR